MNQRRGDILEPRYLLFQLSIFLQAIFLKISILNLLTLALLTVNLAVSTRPTVLQTKKGYGMIILVPLKRRNEANDVTVLV
jgi:hypothetical protein